MRLQLPLVALVAWSVVMTVADRPARLFVDRRCGNWDAGNSRTRLKSKVVEGIVWQVCCTM
jgi:hypothetical protein